MRNQVQEHLINKVLIKEKNMLGNKIFWIFITSFFIFTTLTSSLNSASLQEISADNPNFQYLGRIELSEPTSPVFAYPASACQFNFEGTSLQLKITEDNWGEGNYVGVYLDDNPEPIIIQLEPTPEPKTYKIATDLTNTKHSALIVKRTDFLSGEFSFEGIIIDAGKDLLAPNSISSRKIEFYGDSITAGANVESENVGQQDPEGNTSHLDNSYASYAAMLAKEYNADFHLIAQGGLAVTNGYGYWFEGTGMESVYDKYKPLPDAKIWDFNNYTPDLIVIALGQNDSSSVSDTGKISEQTWKNNYKTFINNLHNKHPQAYIICMFTNMFHDRAWDSYLTEAVTEYKQEYSEAKIYSLITEQVTPGHPRISEQRLMTNALKNLIDNTLMTDGFSWQ